MKFIRLILVGLFTVGMLPAQTILQRLAAPVKFQWGVEPEYQSNPLNFSQLEQDSIANNPAILGSARTIDSGVLTGVLKIYYEPRLFGDYATRITIFSFYHYYTSMSDKNYASVNINLVQPLGNWMYAKAGYSVVPSYYLRHYRDADDQSGNTRYACTYSTDKIWAAFEHRIGKKFTAEYRGQTRVQYYNPHFTEYDMRIREGAVQLGYAPSKRWNFNLTGLYGWAQDINDLDPQNRSYRNLELTPGLAYSWPKGFLHRMSLEMAFRQRDYLSEEENDPLHNGRGQSETELNVTLYPRTTGSFDWFVYGGYRHREVESDFQHTIDLKSFTRWELGLRVTFDTIWDIYL
ncbi:MAG TPA: hypothetical protein DHU63_12480 [Candidatus Marinimicrobia bacterium]|nr:MAG: hypothetical protein AUJ47_01975 [Candidatus Marinimicrobia bacterium CG1_02_48_14]PJA51769.1 MAG: hypothetical protein CO167_12275 [Candidatus Marinimicrobia bacterium CG_4_9_14_3_um_filter_48_9]HCW77335.1 hypothetical protein [Candidatus Neomarinimicrobiota bacterium]